MGSGVSAPCLLSPSDWGRLVSLLILGVMVTPVPAELSITEFQASNRSTLVDEEGDFHDWVEIWNAGEAAIELEGWFLTDDLENLTKWVFPKLRILPKQYLVILASGEDRHSPRSIFEERNSVTKTHTGFKLSAKGEDLALVQPDGVTVVSSIRGYPRQLSDVSYGYLDETWGYFSEPTPGKANAGPLDAVGPIIASLENHTGPLQVDSTSIEIGAEVAETVAAVTSVELVYRVMYGEEQTVPMALQGDAYRGVLPLGDAEPGEMIRWKVRATDAEGRATVFPYQASGEGVPPQPAYEGTVLPSAEWQSSRLPILHWFMETPSQALRESGGRCSFAYEGVLYDDIHVDVHGKQNYPVRSPDGSLKLAYDFTFNAGHRLPFVEEAPALREIQLLSNWRDKTKVRELLAYEIFAETGHPSHFAYPVRVERNGSFYGIFDLIEEPDRRYLERAGLNTEGSLYKIRQSIGTADDVTAEAFDVKVPGDDEASDLVAFTEALVDREGKELSWLLRHRVNLPLTINYLATIPVVDTGDYAHKNYYYYHDTSAADQWTVLPWDLDLTFGRGWIAGPGYFNDLVNTSRSPLRYPGDHALFDAMVDDPVIVKKFERRLRTLLDHYWQLESDLPLEERWLEKRLDAYIELMDPEGAVSDADLDHEKWGSWTDGFTMQEAIADMKSNYIAGRRSFLKRNVLRGLPDSATGAAADGLVLAAVDFDPESGNQDEESLSLRNLGRESIDLSGWQLRGAIEYTFLPGTVILENQGELFSPPIHRGDWLVVCKDVGSYVAAHATGSGIFAQGGYSGRLSSRGESIEMVNPEGEVAMTWSYDGHPDYRHWSGRHFGSDGAFDSAPDGDANGDGYSNWYAYAFGFDPFESIGATLTWASQPDGGATLSFRKIVNESDVRYRAEYSTDLESWVPLDSTWEADRPILGATAETRILRVSADALPSTSAFVRVRAEIEPVD